MISFETFQTKTDVKSIKTDQKTNRIRIKDIQTANDQQVSHNKR
jgi:hypothetical protein